MRDERPGPFAVVWAGTFAFGLSFFLLVAVLPLYARRLGVSDALIGVVTGAFAVSAMLWRPWAGWAADRWGRRPLMLAGALVFLVASLAYGWAGGALALTCVRLVHGTGMGLFPTAASALVTDLAPPERRGHVLGLYGAAFSIAMAIGPLAGVALSQRAGFPTLFAVSAVVALAGVALTAAVREPARPGARLPLRLDTTLARPAVFPSLVLLCLMLTYGVQISFLPLHADTHGINPGIFFLVLSLAVALARGPAGRLSDRYGRPPVAAAGLGFAGAALAVEAAGGGAEAIALAGALYGVGVGAAQPALMAWCVDVVDPGSRGRAMGTYFTALELGIALGAMSSGAAVASLGFAPTFLLTAGVALGGAALAVSWEVRARG